MKTVIWSWQIGNIRYMVWKLLIKLVTLVALGSGWISSKIKTLKDLEGNFQVISVLAASFFVQCLFGRHTWTISYAQALF